MKAPPSLFVRFSLLLLTSFSIVSSAQAQTVYTSVPGSSSLVMIDGATNKVLGSIAIPPATTGGAPSVPSFIALTPDAKFLYVLDKQAQVQFPAPPSAVDIIDTTSNAVVSTILVEFVSGSTTTGGCPDELAFSPDGLKAYVTDRCANSLLVVDTKARTLTTALTNVGLSSSAGLAISPDGSKVYLGLNKGLGIYDTATQTLTTVPLTTIGGPATIFELAATPDGTQVFVSIGAPIYSFDPTAMTFTPVIGVGPVCTPGGIGITPDGKNAFQGDAECGGINDINTSTDTATFFTLPSTKTPITQYISFSADSQRAYASGGGNGNTGGNVQVFNVNTHALIALIPVGTTNAFGVTVMPTSSGAQAATTTTLTSSANPSTFGSAITLTATVAASSGTPTGTVTFFDASSSLGSSPLNSPGSANLTSSSLTAGTHTITASYGGDSNFSPSASTPLTQTVNSTPTPLATATTLSASANTSTYGQAVTLSATVSSSQNGMTGTVTFTSGATVLGKANVAAGAASLNVVLGNVGTYSVIAAYSGDSNFSSSKSSPLTLTVNKESTSCNVSYADLANPNLTVPNSFDLANIDVQVTPQNPSGLITSLLGATTSVSDNGSILTQLASGSSVQSAIGQDTFTPGTHVYTGNYSGDTNNLPSQCTLTLTIPKAKTSLMLTSSLNPSAQGQMVVLSAKINLVAGFVPSGGVTFSDGGTLLATVPFDGFGTASYSTTSLGAGVHTVTANYSGDQNFFGSSATLTQTVTASNGGGGGTCACTKTGGYVNPVGGVVPTAGSQTSASTYLSPNAKYQLTISIDNANQNATLGISLAGTLTQVLPTQTLPITAAGGWGFSPDNDRFVISFLDNIGQSDELKETYVYDLSVVPARVVVHIASSNSGFSQVFSPSGRYFVYRQLLGASQAEVQIYRVQGVTSQDLVFDSGVYSFAVGSGTDLQTGSSGFSPDNPETSFIYSYVTGQTTFQWNLVNLASGKQIVNVTYNSTTAGWAYSPCADVVGVVWQVTSMVSQIDLYATDTGKTLQGSGTLVPAPDAGLETTSSGQEAVYLSNGQIQTILLSPPTCNQLNTPTGSNVNVTPRDPGNATSPMSVTFASVTQAGQTSVTVSNTGTAPPSNFQPGNPPTFYDLTTTAAFSGAAVVCIKYGGITFNNQSAIKLYHFESGAWMDRTISINTASDTVCGSVTSFSPFALFEPQGPGAANILATAGTPQTASIFGAFPAGLRATVTDSGGSPVSGVIVTFTAPAVGATGSFVGSGVLATVTTDASGVATAPPFTASGNVGSYTVSATVNGVSTPANFLLVNSPAATTVSVASLGSPTYGSPLTFTATVVTPVGTPTGTVAFSDGGNSLGVSQLTGLNATLTNPSLSAGVHAITASYSGDSRFSGSTSTLLAVTVNPAPLVIAANNASRPYGANNPAFTGTVSGLLNSDPISRSFGSSASPASLVGTYPIVPSVIGAPNVLNNYAIHLANGALIVAPERTSLTIALSPLSIPVGQSTTATVTLTAPDMVIPIDPSVLASIALTSPVASDILSNNGACTPVPSVTPGVASCVITVTSVEPNGRTLNASFAGSADLTTSSSTANLIVTAALNSQQVCIASGFRNVAVPGGSTIWFNSIFKVRDVTRQLIHVTFYQSNVQFQYTDASGNLVNVNQALPDAHITIDPSATTASTAFDSANNVWVTTIPWDLDDNAFLTGVPWVVSSAGMPRDIEPVMVCGTFASDVANIDVGWRWAAAAYSSFGSTATLGVKSMYTDHDNPGTNRDPAGTPENYKQYVIPGARGKGGKNYTGSYSGGSTIE